jgi:predicted transcriptional regulator
VAQEEAVPDDQPLTSHVSLRIPNDLIEAFDRIATALERPRSWVMVRALRQYLEEGEGREIEEDTESLAELDRGESAPFEESLEKVREIIAEKKRAREK